jgi:hypothetical protein
MEISKLHFYQKTQQEHDLANHFEILCLHKVDRLKHYGLHYSKYVGRLARHQDDLAVLKSTLVDAFLISLSAANSLNQRLYKIEFKHVKSKNAVDFYDLADAVGRFADGCEKIDHLESFRDLVIESNADIVMWILSKSAEIDLDIDTAVAERRAFLAARAAYH